MKPQQTAGQMLRAARLAADMTQDQLVEELHWRGHHYTRQAVSAWEAGRPPAHVLIALEMVLELDAREMLQAIGGER